MDAHKRMMEFLMSKEFQNEDEFQAAVAEYNQLIAQGQFDDYMANNIDDFDQSDDYLQLAYEACSVSESKKYFKKALEINPDNIDAKLGLIRFEKGPFKKLEKLIVLKNEAMSILINDNIITEEDYGHFWQMFETRPFMRVTYALMQHMNDIGFEQQACAVGEEILFFNESDNLGVRFDLMTCCYRTNHIILAMWLEEKYNDPCALFVIPLLGIFIRAQEIDRAIGLVKKAEKFNPGFVAYFSNISDKKLMDAYEFAQYSTVYSHGLQEFQLALDKNNDVVLDQDIPGFLKKHFKKQPTTSKSKIKH